MTATQYQLLLAYLGYDPGPIDGSPGKLTTAAVTAFQRDSGLTADGICGHDTQGKLVEWVASGRFEPPDAAPVPAFNPGTGWAKVRYFTRGEFRCPCGRCGGFPAEPAEALVGAADDIRGAAGAPGHISSGVRCQAHNGELSGSVKNSRHLRGRAMDWRIDGLSSAQLLARCNAHPAIKFAYAIDGRYVHMDIGD